MLSLHRTIHPRCALLQRSVSEAAMREYHGDPGPSTVRRRQQSPSPHPRDGRLARVGPSRDAYPRSSLPSPRPFQAIRNSRFPASPRSPSRSPLGRHGKTSAVVEADAYDTSHRLKAWLRTRPELKTGQFDELMTFVSETPKNKVNAVVWNQVLGVLGQHGKMDRMWKAYNDMKKRGVTPTSRTFTTLLNAFAGVPHLGAPAHFSPIKPPTERTFQRVIAIYNQSQAHIDQCVTKLAQKANVTDPEIGLAGSTPLREMNSSMTVQHDESEINLGPTNAYLKFLGRYGLWSQMDKVHIAMDKTGRLAPDNITYSVLFSAMSNRMTMQGDKRYADVRAGTMSLDEFGAAVRGLWDEAVRQFHPPQSSPFTEVKSRTRRIDEELALHALQCFFKARPSEHRLATSLIPFLWNLPDPSAVAPASLTTKHTPTRPDQDIPPHMRNIPLLNTSVVVATSITSILTRAGKHRLAATLARHFLSLEHIKTNADFALLRTSIHALASGGDVNTITSILDTHQPPTGKMGWPVYVWDNALFAARWASDFDSAVGFFRRMTHLAHGVEEAVPPAQRKPYVWHRPNDQPVDVQGHKWHKPDPVPVTAKGMSLLFKTALTANEPSVVDRNVRKAYNIFSSYNAVQLFTIPASEFGGKTNLNLLSDTEIEVNGDLIRAAEWRLSLAQDVQRAVEVMLERADKSERGHLEQVKQVTSDLYKKRDPVLGSKAFKEAKKKPASQSLQVEIEGEQDEWLPGGWWRSATV